MSVKPSDEKMLCESLRNIAGLSLGELASRVCIPPPKSALHGKGWIGQLMEAVLGADQTSKPEPDFSHLGIELKTVPIDKRNKAAESTYVCSIPLLEIHKQTWEMSTVKRKLNHVLWLPIESSRTKTLADRRVGQGFLWKMDAASEVQLRQDWEELTEMIVLGRLHEITGKHGTILQIRPKAANAKATCWAVGPEGERVKTLPRGFYLRAKFTNELLVRSSLRGGL